MSCSDVPTRREGGRECCLDKEDVLHRHALGLSAEPLVNGSTSAMGLCVNWNQYYTRCFTGNSNPHKGAINFDNIGYAWIVIFQVITLEGWVEIMYYVMDAHSFYNFIYFIFLIIVRLVSVYRGGRVKVMPPPWCFLQTGVEDSSVPCPACPGCCPPQRAMSTTEC
ncbi:hypothetical protein NFI96_007852 [Prochilodus magdalenae]|nr:hypothetical protein NFI96_007852 [Prochilodus magdalenae]